MLKYVKMCLYACAWVCMYCTCVINVKSVTEQLCLEQSLRSCYFVQWLNCFFPHISFPLSSSPSVYLSVSVSPSSLYLFFTARFDFPFYHPPPSLSETWWDAQIVNKKYSVPPQTYWSHTHQSDGRNRLWLMGTKGLDATDRVCELLYLCVFLWCVHVSHWTQYVLWDIYTRRWLIT